MAGWLAESIRPNQFVPEIVSPLPCSPALVRQTLLIVYFFFFKKLISFIGSPDKCRTSVFIALISKGLRTGSVCANHSYERSSFLVFFSIFLELFRTTWKLHNLWLATPYTLANHKMYFINFVVSEYIFTVGSNYWMLDHSRYQSKTCYFRFFCSNSPLPHNVAFWRTKENIGKHCEKGKIACNKQSLLFSQCFPACMVLIFHFKSTVKYRLQFVSIWTSLKFCRLGMG